MRLLVSAYLGHIALREIREIVAEMLAAEADRSGPRSRQSVHEARRGLRSRLEMSELLNFHQHAPVGLIFES